MLVRLFNVRPLSAKKLLKQALVIKDVMIIVRALKDFSKGRRILDLITKLFNAVFAALENRLRTKLVRCATEALEAGNWIDFQQVALVSEELGIDLPEKTGGDHYLPPKAAEGYQHLGYYIPQTMVFVADCLRDGGRLFLNVESQREWKYHVKTCKRLGVNSSLWKILALSSTERIRLAARQSFKLCEYGFFKSFLDWKKYSTHRQPADGHGHSHPHG